MYERQEICLHGFGCETYGKEPLGRPSFVWQDNIKNSSLRSVMGRHGVGYSGLGYGQVAGTCACGNEL